MGGGAGVVGEQRWREDGGLTVTEIRGDMKAKGSRF